jgi:putative RNA 2'-phosphotransferase
MSADKKSRLLIKALRHQPDILGLKLDDRGWANVCDVLKSLGIDRSCLDIIVSTNSKQRFEYNENHSKIRASQGHSIQGIEVFKDWSRFIPLGPLYHGTADYSVGPIMKDKLVSKTRTHVHLSKDIETAYNVGKRHGDPIILQIDAEKMRKDGYKFYESKNGVILIEEVPSTYIKALDKGQLINLGFTSFI